MEGIDNERDRSISKKQNMNPPESTMFYTLLDYSAIREEILKKAPAYCHVYEEKKGRCEKLEGIQLWTAVGLVLKQNLAGRWGGGPGRVVLSRKKYSFASVFASTITFFKCFKEQQEA